MPMTLTLLWVRSTLLFSARAVGRSGACSLRSLDYSIVLVPWPAERGVREQLKELQERRASSQTTQHVVVVLEASADDKGSSLVR